jgi:hypothetical protein
MLRHIADVRHEKKFEPALNRQAATLLLSM